MSTLIKKYPAVSLFILSLILGLAPLALVVTGLLPPAYFQMVIVAIVIVLVFWRRELFAKKASAIKSLHPIA